LAKREGESEIKDGRKGRHSKSQCASYKNHKFYYVLMSVGLLEAMAMATLFFMANIFVNYSKSLAYF